MRVTGAVILLLVALFVFGCSTKGATIHSAASVGDIEAVERYLSRGTPIEEGMVIRGQGKPGHYTGKTPLYIAAESGQVRMVCFLIMRGAKVNAKDSRGQEPLYAAVRALNDEKIDEYVKIIDLLIKQGADINARYNYENESSLLHEAVKYSPAQIVKALLEHGAEVDIRTKEGVTPLHSLINESGQIDKAKMLLEYGADINAKDVRGRTPLQMAIIHNNPELAAWLRKQGGVK